MPANIERETRLNPIDQIVSKIKDGQRFGNRLEGCCPVHSDRRRELVVWEGPDGKVRANCSAGCPEESIFRAWELGYLLDKVSTLSPVHGKGQKPERERNAAATPHDARSDPMLPKSIDQPRINASRPQDDDSASISPWPEVMSLDEVTLPDFPIEVLPPVLNEWVAAESHATQTPADLAGLTALAVCSASIARQVSIEARPGYVEPTNLFVTVILDPGNRKSAVFGDATRRLREIEQRWIEEARPTVAAQQSERRQDEARLRKYEKLSAEKNDQEARHQAGELAAELAKLNEPVLPRLICDDATIEKLAIMLAEQGGRIASMSAEGGVFDLMAGKYSKSGTTDFNNYLLAHSGDNIISDRVSRKSISIVKPALTCAYAVQPQVIAGLAENAAAFRGRGLLARFLYAVPRSWIGSREIAAAPVPDQVREAYHGVVYRLAEECRAMEQPISLTLTSFAESKLRQWEHEVEAMLGDGGEMELHREWGAKLVGATLRMAAVLHCVEFKVNSMVEANTIEAAIVLARYLIPHSQAAMDLIYARQRPDEVDARYLLQWIKRHSRQVFTKSEAQQQCKRRFPQADSIDAPLDELESRGYIRLREAVASGPGRPASPTYEVNPMVSQSQRLRTRPGYSENPATQAKLGGYQNMQSDFLRGVAATNEFSAARSALDARLVYKSDEREWLDEAPF